MHFLECKNYQIYNVLLKTTKDINSSSCEEQTGYGLIQAKSAYESLAKREYRGNLSMTDLVGRCQQ